MAKKIMVNDEADEVIKEIFQSIFSRYQIGLETTMKGSNFSFDCVNLFYYKWHKINMNCVGSHINSPYWTKNKKETINPINDDKFFQEVAQLEIISTIKPFVHKYNWEPINFSSG